MYGAREASRRPAPARRRVGLGHHGIVGKPFRLSLPSSRGPVSADQRNVRPLNADHNARAETTAVTVTVAIGVSITGAGVHDRDATKATKATETSSEPSGVRNNAPPTA